MSLVTSVQLWLLESLLRWDTSTMAPQKCESSFCVQIYIAKDAIVTIIYFKAFSAVYFSDVGSAQRITLYGVL